MSINDISKKIREMKESIILIYAFNATGKTRLSVAYKNTTKDKEQHTGVYYNAFSEDIFFWDNDTDNNEQDIKFIINHTTLNKFHSTFTEEHLYHKLKPFQPKYDFSFIPYKDNPEKGIKHIVFYEDTTKERVIKISRAEERIFVWCFFLMLFEHDDWSGQQSSHFFIDDPVSSLDDHNIFITVSTLYDLIEKHYEKRKFIITTHHIGFFSSLSDWLTKGEKSNQFKDKTKLAILSKKSGKLSLETARNDVFLYHLRLLQVLEKAQKEQLYSFHFGLLRQLLENIASFLGVGQFSYVLKEIGISDPSRIANIINILSHKKSYYYESDVMVDNNKDIFNEIFNGIKNKYNFVIHASKK